MDLVARWKAFRQLVEARGMGWALHFAPPALQWARRSLYPRGASVDDLLPGDYREFVAEVGYPVWGQQYYDREGFSFLPPAPMQVLSVMIPDARGTRPAPLETGPTPCRQAFFAGIELAEYDGFCFAPGASGTPAVWRVEGGRVAGELGPFGDWMSSRVDELHRAVSELSSDDVAWLREENNGEADPHRLIDYSLESGYDVPAYSQEDLRVAWVKGEDTYGLIDADGRWVLPPSERFRRVRPFRGGVAEVVLHNEQTTYSGPWSTIRLDGTVA